MGESLRRSDWGGGLGTSTASRSFELESWNYVQHEDYQLNLLTKTGKQAPSRRVIPAVEMERLSYFRGLCSSVFRIQIQYLQQYNYAQFLRLYIYNVIFRSLPLNYILVFLGDYSPDEHFFISHMSPLCIGAAWQIALASLLQLVSSSDTLSMLGHYAFTAFIIQSPWDNCDEVYYQIHGHDDPTPHRCYKIDEFYAITINKSFCGNDDGNGSILHENNSDYKFIYNFYHWNPQAKAKFGLEGKFTAGPLSYFLRIWSYTSMMKTGVSIWILYYALMWIGAGICYKELFNRRLWKVLNYSQLGCNVVYVFCTLYMIFQPAVTSAHDSIHEELENIIEFAAGTDFDYLSEVMSAPPVIHMLTARSADRPVDPGRDSVMITASNVVMYLFKGVINYQLKLYCEGKAGTILLASWYNPFPIFYLWAFFFHQMIVGDFVLRIFYMMLFICEVVIFAVTTPQDVLNLRCRPMVSCGVVLCDGWAVWFVTIRTPKSDAKQLAVFRWCVGVPILTYQVLVEAMACEWKWARRSVATITLSISGFLLSVLLNHEVKRYLYIYSTAITAVTELVVVCWMYPLGRLNDDIYFQFGKPPNKYRIWSLRLVTFYALYKLYHLEYSAFFLRKKMDAKRKMKLKAINADHSCVEWVWIGPVLPLFLGFFYAIYKYKIKHKQPWRALLMPRPDWGPREHVTRQLRKQFDSRGYIGSQSSRYLSRHLLAKSGTPTYRLDIRYDVGGRRSTVVSTPGYRGASDRKNL